jgi:AbrB family looped-hinge helix DNA binding protein
MAQAGKTTKRPRLDKQGRVVIPADFRDKLGLEPGTELSMWIEEGQLVIMSLDEALRRVRGIIKKRAGRRSMVDELIAERRAAAALD